MAAEKQLQLAELYIVSGKWQVKIGLNWRSWLFLTARVLANVHFGTKRPFFSFGIESRRALDCDTPERGISP